jgi:hypothetical protein
MAEEDGRPEEQEGGLSTAQKVVAGAALGVAIPAAVGAARKLIGGDGDHPEHEGHEEHDEEASSEPTTRERRSTAGTSRRSSSGRSRSRSTKSGSSKGTTRTREQLYRQATRLKIEGRSRMKKAELERAIARAKAK